MKSVKRAALPLAAALAVTMAQAAPAAAKVVTPTTYAEMQLGTGLFPAGGPVPDGFSGNVPVVAGTSETLTAPQYLYEPPTSSSPTASSYKFAFWDVGAAPSASLPLAGTLIATLKATFTTPAAGTTFDATAWYIPQGGGCGDPLPAGGCGTEAAVSAFSLTYDKPLTQSPIASVTPASAELSPSSVSTIGVSPTIAAQSCLDGTFSKFGCSTDNVFSTWFEIGESSVTPGLDVTVGAGDSPWLVAMYTSPPAASRPPLCIRAHPGLHVMRALA